MARVTFYTVAARWYDNTRALYINVPEETIDQLLYFLYSIGVTYLIHERSLPIAKVKRGREVEKNKGARSEREAK